MVAPITKELAARPLAASEAANSSTAYSAMVVVHGRHQDFRRQQIQP